VKVHWNNIQKCVLDTMSDLIMKIDSIARKLWITQDEWMKEMEECEKKRKNYRRLRNKLKRAIDEIKKE